MQNQRAAAHAELSLLTHIIQTMAEPVGPVRKLQLYDLNKDSRKKSHTNWEKWATNN